MGKLQDRENKRKSVIGGMIDTPTAPWPALEAEAGRR